MLRSVAISSFPISLFQQFCKLSLPSITNDWGPFFVHLEILKLISGYGAHLGIVKIKYRPLTKQISITLVPNLDICDPIKNEIDFLSNDYKKKYVSFFFSFDIENLLEDFFDPDSSHNLIDFHIVSDSDSPLSAELDSFVFSSSPSVPPVSTFAFPLPFYFPFHFSSLLPLSHISFSSSSFFSYLPYPPYLCASLYPYSTSSSPMPPPFLSSPFPLSFFFPVSSSSFLLPPFPSSFPLGFRSHIFLLRFGFSPFHEANPSKLPSRSRRFSIFPFFHHFETLVGNLMK